MTSGVAKEAQTATRSMSASRLGEWVETLLRPQVLLRAGAVLLIALYIRTINFDFVYDDLGLTVAEWRGWHALGGAFLRDIFFSLDGQGSSYYRPLTVVYVAVLHHWSGGLPAWFHLTGVFVHLASYLLAYLVAHELFLDDRLAVLTALLYALHPSKVEPVAWIGSSGCDGLGALFFFGSLYSFLKWRNSGGSYLLAGSLVLYALSLLTKETLAVLPGMIVIQYWLTASKKERLRGTAALGFSYGIVLAAYLVVRHIALSPHVVQVGVAPPYLKPTFSTENIWSAPLAWWWYVKHLVFPTRLSVMYDSIIVSRPTLWNFGAPVVAAAFALAAGLWLWRRNASPGTAFLVSFFVLTLVPYLVLAPMSQQHDRYLYLASFPFCALVAWLLLKPGFAAPQFRFTLGVLIIGLWSASVWHETGFWENNLVLWQRAAVIAPHEVRPRSQVAGQYAQAGEMDAAFQAIAEGLKQHPQSPTLLYGRGALLAKQGEAEKAIPVFESAFNADKVGNTKPVCAARIGEMAMKTNDYALAEKWYRTAAELAPRTPGYRAGLARALSAQGKMVEAQQQEELELRLQKELRALLDSL